MKKIFYLVRHAVAMERADFQKAFPDENDFERPLIPSGVERFAKNVKKLRKKRTKIKRIYTSPFVRCRQTAKLLAKAYKLKSKSLKQLAHGADSLDFVAKLTKLKKHSAFVGHEPELSEIYLDLGLKGPLFKKGEIRCVEQTKKHKKISYKLIWSQRSA